MGEPFMRGIVRSTFGLFVRALFDLNLLRIALRLHFLVLKPVAVLGRGLAGYLQK